MIILAVETSCDDTCISILNIKNQKSKIRDSKFEILSNIISSQVKIHQKYGGVYPFLAKREHQRNLASVLKQSLLEAKLLKSKIKHQISKTQIKIQKLKEILKREEVLYQQLEEFLKNYQKPKIDAIAITIGPGLEPCLWVGVNFAKALSYYWNLPIIPVNHIEAHILANWLSPVGNVKHQISNVKTLFPAVCLVVSGGHTQLILMNNFGKYKILGETRDDAAGECFDKVARILGLDYPGGPAIAAQAQIVRGQASVKLPRPMIKQKNYDFSFSGLKTAVLYNFKKQSPKNRKKEKYIKEICYETQQAIVDVLIKKTIKAAKNYKAKAIILGGGVAANRQFRIQFQQKLKKEKLSFKFYVPGFKFCTDNAVMVGIAGYYNWLKGKTKTWQKIKADANLRID